MLSQLRQKKVGVKGGKEKGKNDTLIYDLRWDIKTQSCQSKSPKH